MQSTKQEAYLENYQAEKLGRVLFVVAKLSLLAKLIDARHMLQEQNMPRIPSR